MRLYDGTRGKFRAFYAAMQMYFTLADFILTLAPLHYATLSETAKMEAVASKAEFLQVYGPQGLRLTHFDCMAVFAAIFSKFSHTKDFLHPEVLVSHGQHGATPTWNAILSAYADTDEFLCGNAIRLFKLANDFDGDNWKPLDATLGIGLQAMDTTLTLRDLLAMHLMRGMQAAGRANPVWQRACHELQALKKNQWCKKRQRVA